MNEQQVFQGLQQAQAFAPQQQQQQMQGFAPQQQTQQTDNDFVLRVPLMYNHAQKGRIRCFIEKRMTTGTNQEAQQIILGLEAQGYPVEWWGGQEQEQDNGFSGSGQQRNNYNGGGYNRRYGRRNYGGRY